MNLGNERQARRPAAPNRRGLRLAAAILVACAGTAVAGTISFGGANFDDKTIDAPIGTGGPGLDEPTGVDPSITAIVRATPMGSPSLEITDNSDVTAGTVRFELHGHDEVVDGVVTFRMDLWFAELEQYHVYIREQGGSSRSFLSMRFGGDGNVNYNDTESGGSIGTYETGRVIPLEIMFDQNLGTYDITLDGLLVLEDRAHGVTDRGVGAVLIGCGFDQDFDGRVYVDNLEITGDGVTPTVTTSWGGVKATFDR